MLIAKDDDGSEVRAGDWISFSYGIPPVGVRARISEQGGRLKMTVLGKHKPRTMLLADLRRHVGNWYKADGPSYQA